MPSLDSQKYLLFGDFFRYRVNLLDFALSLSVRDIMFSNLVSMPNRVEKSGEHPRFSPGTHKARNYLKDVRIALQAICPMKIAQ